MIFLSGRDPMICPYCGKTIGGHVRPGTQAYSRVSKGQCPHCGLAMPHGHKVDFVTSSGEFASDARKRIGTQARQREARKRRLTDELANAQAARKKVRFHAVFGAIGVFWLFFCSLGIQDGQFVFIMQGVKEAIFPAAIAFVAGAAYWFMTYGTISSIFKKQIKGNEGRTVISQELEKAVDKYELRIWIFTILSWFLFWSACFLSVGVLFHK